MHICQLFCPGFFISLFSVWLLACQGPPPRFERLSPRQTGVDFVNEVIESDSFNVMRFTYIYNGAGVGIGDFDQDGRSDLFFAGNMRSSRLYLNRGDWQFEDVSAAAGIHTTAWCTGVAVVDLNDDGWPDVYVSVAYSEPGGEGRNLFFEHQGLDAEGVPVFVEKAAAYGLDDPGYSTQAAFFDYDGDGDLDVYILTNGLAQTSRNAIEAIVTDGSAPSTDRLYRNNGDGTFSNVSAEAGITIEGWGLGVAVNDFNLDGWPDVYIANDFISNDLLWINNGDGTFSDRITDYLKHQSHNGMGADVADFNNDGLVDIMVLDMMPDDNLRQKSMFPPPNYSRFLRAMAGGYHPQYVRNTLQLNNGDGTFSEIGQLAGIHKTDWSWAPLFADFDNDGWRDLFITNGYPRDVTDLDYVNFTHQANLFGTTGDKQERVKEALAKLGGVHKPNFMFRNQGDWRFEDVSEAWGFTRPSYSNGAAFADLDGDGDLDLVLNNLNEPAALYRNNLIGPAGEAAPLSLRFALQGPPGNRLGIGARLTLWGYSEGGEEEIKQYHYHTLARGYKSSMEPIVHFGAGQDIDWESLQVVWPDGKDQLFEALTPGQVMVLDYQDAQAPGPPGKTPPGPILQPVSTPAAGLAFLHRETDHVDFNLQVLLPHKHSQAGPAMAVGDVDGNGLDDLWIGGSAGETATLFMQTRPGRFQAQEVGAAEARHEDMGGLLFDADGDGDLDLYVASGGSERRAGIDYYRHRFYRNVGQGQFRLDTAAIPPIFTSSSVVTACDYDGDGDLDLFVGGSLTPLRYPEPPLSHLLRNEGGRFVDVTASVAPALAEAGMIRAALWSDFDQDGQPDLIVAGEWTPIRFYRQDAGRLVPYQAYDGSLTGWWNSLVAGDFDHDGDIDYVAGNAGLNSDYQASPQAPLCLYVKDFDENGAIDPIMSQYIQGVAYPVPGLDQLRSQVVSVRKRFRYYHEYGRTTMADLFSPAEWAGAETLAVHTLASTYLENLGNGRFKARPLPVAAQIAPVFGMLAQDIDGDGTLDLVLIGNSHAPDTHHGWQDASYGLILRGDGKGNLDPLPARHSGWRVPGDGKALVNLQVGPDRSWLVAAANRDSLRVYDLPGQRLLPYAPGEVAALVYRAGRPPQRFERSWGSGYLSQSSAVLGLEASFSGVEAVVFIHRDGSQRRWQP